MLELVADRGMVAGTVWGREGDLVMLDPSGLEAGTGLETADSTMDMRVSF